MPNLDDLPTVNSFFGIDLRTGSLMIAAISIMHPMAFICTFFTPMSYLLVTIWVLVMLYFATSIALLCGIMNNERVLCNIWLWYTLVFVVIMLLLMIMLAIVYATKMQRCRVFIVLLGIIYYLLTFYFIIVVNSQCKKFGKASRRRKY